MSTTDREPSDKSSSKDTRPSEEEVQGRYPTSAERADLIEDAKAFKRRHEKAFRILSEAEGDE